MQTLIVGQKGRGIETRPACGHSRIMAGGALRAPCTHDGAVHILYYIITVIIENGKYGNRNGERERENVIRKRWRRRIRLCDESRLKYFFGTPGVKR